MIARMDNPDRQNVSAGNHAGTLAARGGKDRVSVVDRPAAATPAKRNETASRQALKKGVVKHPRPGGSAWWSF